MRKLIAVLTVLSLSVLAAACSVPDDEAWLRITGFEDGDGSVSVYRSDLRDGEADDIDVLLQNVSVPVGSSNGTGTSIHIYRAKVEYTFSGYSLPSYEYAVTLTIWPEARANGTDSTDTTTTTTTTVSTDGEGTLENLPLIPVSLKNWLLIPDNVPEEITATSFQAEAKVTIRARTDEGTELKTSGSLGIIFN